MADTFKENVTLSQYTTLQVGGLADYVAIVENQDDLEAAVSFAELHTDKPPLVLGGGSNVLINDSGYRGLVILMRSSGITFSVPHEGTVLVEAKAGVDWDDLVLESTKQGLWGLENLSGIPGTVGAAPVQNINAYGAAVSDTIISVEAYDFKNKAVINFTKEQCQFGYRDSIFKNQKESELIITSVTFALQEKNNQILSYKSSSQSIEKILALKKITAPAPEEVRVAVLEARHNIGMLRGQFNSAGSFFKNTIVDKNQFLQVKEIVDEQFPQLATKLMPWYWEVGAEKVKISTAFLMECSPYNKNTFGEERYRGVVGLSPKHSLSIVTEVGVTAIDVKNFVDEIILAIENIFKIKIETEVIYF